MKRISQKKAIELLTANPGATVVLPDKYRDGTPDNRPVWLEDGELVYTHPTDPVRGTVRVQSDDRLALE